MAAAMTAGIIAALVLLVILVAAYLAGSGVAAAAVALAAGAGTAAGLLARGAPRVFGGGHEDSPAVPTAPFRGEDVFKDFLPFLEAITAAPLERVPDVLEDLEEGPPYQTFRPRVDAVLHYGQRKLLLAEVGFLSRYGHLGSEVVYVGAAPGIHIPYLARLFPEHRFTLYDTGDFLLRGCPEALKRIKTHSRYFTAADAEALRGKGVLFVSDIRTGLTDEDTHDTHVGDMKRQRGWVETIEPAATSLKFRLPWGAGETEYFDAPLWLQAWAPGATNEVRQEFEGVPPTKLWDHDSVDRRLNYLNGGLRQWAFYEGDLPRGVPGVDHCYDCAREIATWEAYREARPSKASVAELMNGATRATKQRLNSPPHGVDPDTPMADKREALIAACRRGEMPCTPRWSRSKKRKKALLRRRKRAENKATQK